MKKIAIAILMLTDLLIGSALAIAAPRTLVFTLSDQHSYYQYLENFIRSKRVLEQQFLKENPDGKVIVDITGDFSGVNEWTAREKGLVGQLGYDALALLSSGGETYNIGFGNHEGLDRGGEKGNQLFLQQSEQLLKTLSQNAGEPVYLIGSNFELSPAAAKLIRPYRDVIAPTGERQRYIGGLFDNFYAKTSKAAIKIFGPQIPLLDQMKTQIELAARDGIKTVYFMMHEDHVQLAKRLEELFLWMASRPEFAQIQIPVVYAAHSHKIAKIKVGDTWIINSGSHWQYTAVTLDENGRLVESQFMNFADQERVGQTAELSAIEEKVITKVRDFLNSATETKTPPRRAMQANFLETKFDLKAGRAELGNLICDALKYYGVDEAAKLANEKPVSNTFGFLFSSTYRREVPLQGAATQQDFYSMFPFAHMPVRILELPGSAIQKIYAGIRRKRLSTDQDYSPQLSSNLRESENFQLEEKINDVWIPLDAHKTYRLVLDHWLAVNGPEIPELQQVFQNESTTIKVRSALTEANILSKYGPKLMRERCNEGLHAQKPQP
jgi:hypothetical protein